MCIDKADSYAYRKLTFSSARFLDLLYLFQWSGGVEQTTRNLFSVWSKELCVLLIVSVTSHYF